MGHNGMAVCSRVDDGLAGVCSSAGDVIGRSGQAEEIPCSAGEHARERWATLTEHQTSSATVKTPALLEGEGKGEGMRQVRRDQRACAAWGAETEQKTAYENWGCDCHSQRLCNIRTTHCCSLFKTSAPGATARVRKRATGSVEAGSQCSVASQPGTSRIPGHWLEQNIP